MDRFIAAIVTFVVFFAACRFAPSKMLTSGSFSVELSVAESEKDTDALVTNSDSDASASVEESSEQKQLQQQRENMSVFRILIHTSGIVFGSVASVVFFFNMFFITIGTNVVEGLVCNLFL
jgi:hypothetical protein